MTRDEAKKLGLKRFVPLGPCERGHVAMRNTARGYCLRCYAEDAQKREKSVQKPTVLPTSREQARELGSKTYLLPTPCAQGHRSPRNTKHGYCLACEAERVLRWRQSKRPKATETRPMSRGEAKHYGLKVYVPLEPCPHHPESLWHTGRGWCLECRAEELRRGRPVHTPVPLPPKPKTASFQYLSPQAWEAVMALADQWLEYDKARGLDGLSGDV